MELTEALRTTGAIRSFTDEAVDHAVVHRVLDSARFAPNGGNRQAWRVIVVDDPEVRRGLAALYAGPWDDYLALRAANLTPWPPIGDRAEEARVVDESRRSRPDDAPVSHLVATLFEAPVVLVVLADQTALVATDRDLGRHPMVSGASIYPFVWSILLAARDEGLGGVLTTMHARVEPAVKELLAVPEDFALAAVLALGHPVERPTRLRRQPVDTFATFDRFDGTPLASNHG